MELELQTASAKGKKKKQSQVEMNVQLFSNQNNRETTFNDSDIDNCYDSSIKEIENKLSPVFNTDKVAVVDNIDSKESSRFPSKSVNVVVDIHRECKEERKEALDKKPVNLALRESEDFKVLSKAKVNSNKRQNVQRLDDENSVVEYKESLIEKNYNSTATNIDQSIVVKKFHNRKQWTLPNDQVEELKKPARKRWSKNKTVIQLPEVSDVPSTEDVFSSIEHLKQSSLNSFSGIDNATFDLENEEILRVETGRSREDMKIEMKEIGHELKYTGSATISSSKGRRAFEETTITIEDLNEVTSLNNAARFNEFNHGDTYLQKGKRNYIERDKENALHSLEEIAAQSNEDQFLEETSKTNDSQLLLDKKKKKRIVKKYSKEYSLSTTGDEDFDEDHLETSSQRLITSTIEDNDFGNEIQSRKSNKRKMKLKSSSLREKISSSSVDISNSNVKEDRRSKREKRKKIKKKDTKYISITIHRANMLEIDYVTKHPMVKVHIVKAENGKYLKNKQGTSMYLQPMITAKFDFKEHRSIIPVWEETLVFEHEFNELLKTDGEQIVILFEIVDLLSFTEASFNYNKFGHEDCWHKIAYAFLKPVGKNNILHIDKKVQLQLYRPRENSKKFKKLHMCDVYTWWKSNYREKYPSSLFVTVTSVDPPQLEPVLYRQLSFHDVSNTCNESQKIPTCATDSINMPIWTRLAAQSCKIPNEVIFETNVSENGCFYVAFSNDGKYLACSFSEDNDYPIIVYEVETKAIHVRFSGHKAFVYTLNWSDNNNYLLSVSSDQTARIWDVQNQIVQHIEMMPHPSYVYCGKFDPEDIRIIVTGCYDRMARVWIRSRKSKNRDLSQELEGHEGFVNSMCFQKNSNLLTADSVGIIIIWALNKSRKVLSRREWHILRKIKVREIVGVIINTIVLHPLQSRLLVHSRNSELRMLDLATGVVLQKYNELKNQRIQSTACISPCGSLILCGNEDSSLNVWNLESGNLLAKYTFDKNYRAVTCVDYHPYDHVLAFSAFGGPAPVRIFKFNKDATGESVGLKIMGEIENTASNSSISTRLSNTSAMPSERSRSRDKKKTTEEAPKKRNLQFSRSHDSSLLQSCDSIPLGTEKYKDTNLKLQRLNEVRQTLKSQSTDRLYSIIKKIDRILSNTPRSPSDIESGRNFTSIQESGEYKILTSLNDNVQKKKEKLVKTKLTYKSNNSYFDTSITSSDVEEVVQLEKVQSVKEDDWNTKKRSKSTKGISSNNISQTFSDSAAHSRGPRLYDDEIIKPRENVDKENSAIFHKSNSFKKYSDSNSSDSAETYIIEKNGMQNDSNDTIKILENRDFVSDDSENDSNVKYFGSESSMVSNATFIIENEVPTSKSSRRINVA
ncbi:Ahi1 [Anthophora retusa]